MIKVLFVEDELEANHFLIDALRDEGHQVETAADIAEAEDKLATDNYDLVVLDIMLPDKKNNEVPLIERGIHLLEKIRKGNFSTTSENVPIIIVTAVPENLVRDQINVEDYLPIEILGKPFTAEKFIEKISSLVNKENG